MKSEWRLHERYHADRESIKTSEIERKVSENKDISDVLIPL